MLEKNYALILATDYKKSKLNNNITATKYLTIESHDFEDLEHIIAELYIANLREREYFINANNYDEFINSIEKCLIECKNKAEKTIFCKE